MNEETRKKWGIGREDTILHYDDYEVIAGSPHGSLHIAFLSNMQQEHIHFRIEDLRGVNKYLTKKIKQLDEEGKINNS